MRRDCAEELYLTVVAVDALSRVTGVGVSLEVALGELEVLARDNGVQGEGGAGEDFAGVAVAQDGVLAAQRACQYMFPLDSRRNVQGCGNSGGGGNDQTYLGSSTTHSALRC